MSRPPEKIFIMHLKPQFLQEIETGSRRSSTTTSSS